MKFPIICLAFLLVLSKVADGRPPVLYSQPTERASGGIPGYLGCYEDKGEDDTMFEEDSEWEDEKMTVTNGSSTIAQRCIQYCQKEGYVLAALKDGDTCYCGRAGVNYKKYGTKKCKTKCAGDDAQICGEEDEVSVYNVSAKVANFGALAECPKVPSIPDGEIKQGMILTDGAMITFRCNDGYRLCGPRTLTCVTPPMGKPVWDQALPTCERIPGYVGCFDNEDTDPFLFDLSTKWSDDAMTVEKCISRCSTEGFSFAGLMDGDECYCAKTGLNFTAYGRKRCKDRCEGDTTQVCGEDDDQVSVYDVVWYNMVFNAGNGTAPVIG